MVSGLCERRQKRQCWNDVSVLLSSGNVIVSLIHVSAKIAIVVLFIMIIVYLTSRVFAHQRREKVSRPSLSQQTKYPKFFVSHLFLFV